MNQHFFVCIPVAECRNVILQKKINLASFLKVTLHNGARKNSIVTFNKTEKTWRREKKRKEKENSKNAMIYT